MQNPPQAAFITSQFGHHEESQRPVRPSQVQPTVFLMLTAFCLIVVVETMVGYRIVRFDRLIDPDSYMRIVRIRDGMRAGVFTHLVNNDDSGNGTVVYWSHLLDFIILLLRAPLRLFLDEQQALLTAAAITGPVFAGLLAAALVWVPAPLVQPRVLWLWLAVVAMGISPILFAYGLFGYAHYHLPLVLLTVLAAGCAGRAAFGRASPAIWCGLCSSAAIWFTPEAVPYVLMAMGAIAVAWCSRPEVIANSLAVCGATFAALLIGAVLVDPPNGGIFSPEIDCLSIVYAVLGVLVCMASLALSVIGRYTRSAAVRSICCLFAGSAVIGVWLWLYPDIVHGLSALVPAADAKAYFGAISEMQPVPASAYGISLLGSGIAAVLSALCLSYYRRSVLWAYAAGCSAVVVALAASYMRFVGYSEAVGLLAVPITLGLLQGHRIEKVRLLVLVGFVTVFFLPIITFEPNRDGFDPMANCRVADILPVLDHHGGAVVLTEISDTPEILWRSPVRTTGSLYHRSIGAFLRARDAWRTGPSSDVPAAVLATGATEILACDVRGRFAFVLDLPPETLQDRLSRHEVPSWLHEVGSGGGYHLYAISR